MKKKVGDRTVIKTIHYQPAVIKMLKGYPMVMIQGPPTVPKMLQDHPTIIKRTNINQKDSDPFYSNQNNNTGAPQRP